jgi:hypothetical protein
MEKIEPQVVRLGPCTTPTAIGISSYKRYYGNKVRGSLVSPGYLPFFIVWSVNSSLSQKWSFLRLINLTTQSRLCSRSIVSMRYVMLLPSLPNR